MESIHVGEASGCGALFRQLNRECVPVHQSERALRQQCRLDAEFAPLSETGLNMTAGD